jgi:hypothetical protein
MPRRHFTNFNGSERGGILGFVRRGVVEGIIAKVGVSNGIGSHRIG